MDLLAHTLYGTMLCSRSGIAGGRTGRPGIPWYRDNTVLAAALVSLLPDAISMWIPFAVHFSNGAQGHFFHWYGGNWLIVYRVTHSLVTALAVTAILWRWRRRWVVPSLAWSVHVLCDAVSHGAGKFQTMPFYPFSTWGIEGIAFWRHAWFTAGYWIVILVVLLCIIHMRHTPMRAPSSPS